ncbi:type II toxin-antitoxin system Phd/YefM family antitoxin [Candidatus Roizmanbacteria bacterium]|nr:type II toxin-antitoxin system Phd/YefM family antitoxin [Candidatus Roizmanbacteria bacterium]
MLIPTPENTKNVTELREKTLEVLRAVKKYGIIYVMQRSDPKAILISLEEFQRMQELVEDYLDELDARELAKKPRGRGIPLSAILKRYSKKRV